jgi:hypothetical protein
MPDASLALDAANSGLGLSASMRVAHLAPWLGPIDICVQAPGSQTFMGPLITPGDAGTGSLDGSTVEGGPPNDGSAFDGMTYAPDSHADDGASLDAQGSSPDVGSSEAGAAEAGELDGMATDGGGTAGATGAGLSPLAVSRYIELPSAGTFDFAIVRAGSGSCGTPYFTQQVTLDAGKMTTVVLTLAPGPAPNSGVDASGFQGGMPLGLLSFTDEPDVLSSAARMRFINVARLPNSSVAGVALSVGVVDWTGMLWPLASVVNPDSVASPSSIPPVVDELGYHQGLAVDTVGGQDRDAVRVGTIGDSAALSWTSDRVQLDLSPASVHTGFILAGTAGQFAVLWCDDRTGGLTGTDCMWIGP